MSYVGKEKKYTEKKIHDNRIPRIRDRIKNIFCCEIQITKTNFPQNLKKEKISFFIFFSAIKSQKHQFLNRMQNFKLL